MPDVALKQHVEIKAEDKLSYIELIKAFQTYRVFIAIIIKNALAAQLFRSLKTG